MVEIENYLLDLLMDFKKTLSDYATFKKIGLELNEVDSRTFDENKIKMPEKFLNGIVLRDYQTTAVDRFLKDKIGILEIGTGGGKTEIAIEVIRRLEMKTLFIVDKVELLRQTKERLEKALGFEIGQLGHGKTDVRMITVATVQTITKNLNKIYSLFA